MSTDQRGRLRAEFDDILSDDVMTHAEKVEEAIDAAIALDADAGGERLTNDEREAIEGAIGELESFYRTGWSDDITRMIETLRRLAGPHPPQEGG